MLARHAACDPPLQCPAQQPCRADLQGRMATGGGGGWVFQQGGCGTDSQGRGGERKHGRVATAAACKTNRHGGSSSEGLARPGLQ